MTIPTNQKRAIAAIIVVGAALSGAVLLTGRHADKDENQQFESAKETIVSQKLLSAVAGKAQPDVRSVDDKRAAREAPKSADADHDGKPEETKLAVKEGAKRDDNDGATRGPKRVVLGAAEIQSAGIQVAVAGPGTVSNELLLPAEIQFNQDRTAHVVPRVAGTVERVLADLGQRVRQGDVLAVIASGSVSDLRSNLLTAQKRLSFAETTYMREKKLWEEKISAEQDYLQARQAVEESRLAVANVRQKLAAIGASGAGAALNQFAIRAPFNGTVVEKHIVPGDTVKEDAAVFTISDLQTVWADVAISPASLSAVRVGTKVVVQAAGMDARTSGSVSYVGAFMGEQSRMAHARVTLTNPAALWRPGMFATVAVANGEVTAPVTVEADAVQTVDNVPTVFVETAGGFLAREIRPGRGNGRTIEILQGLRSGDRYVATGSFVLKADLGKASVQSDD